MRAPFVRQGWLCAGFDLLYRCGMPATGRAGWAARAARERRRLERWHTTPDIAFAIAEIDRPGVTQGDPKLALHSDRAT